MIFRIVLFFSFPLLSNSSWAYNNIEKLQLINTILLENSLNENHRSSLVFYADTLENINTPSVKFKRGKAILFTVFTGIFGGHRVYFRTHQRTPILYSITLGGLGILPLIDLVHIIFTKDLSKFEDKPQIIMWGK